MKQTVLIESCEVGKNHILNCINLGELPFLRLKEVIETKSGYAFYFIRLQFDQNSNEVLVRLQKELELIICNLSEIHLKFEYLNS